MTALRMSIASTGGTEKASATMDTLQELLEECNDISDVLASGVSPYDNVVDSDLERELRELELDPLYNTSNYSQGDKGMLIIYFYKNIVILLSKSAY